MYGGVSVVRLGRSRASAFAEHRVGNEGGGISGEQKLARGTSRWDP